MAAGLGMDLVEMDRWDRALKRSEGLAASVFSQRERDCWETRRCGKRHLAACFAAKEAFLKALGIGLWQGVPLKQVEVLAEEPGQPRFHLGPRAHAALRAMGCTQARLSVSHEQHMAMAIVVVQ